AGDTRRCRWLRPRRPPASRRPGPPTDAGRRRGGADRKGARYRVRGRGARRDDPPRRGAAPGGGGSNGDGPSGYVIVTRLAVIRHGRTAWTEAKRLQGRTDTRLSPAGAAAVRAWRLPAEIAAFDWFSSPL